MLDNACHSSPFPWGTKWSTAPNIHRGASHRQNTEDLKHVIEHFSISFKKVPLLPGPPQPGVTVKVNAAATAEYLNTKVLHSAADNQKRKKKKGGAISS
jgi:hypothetical protein